jgi:predicted nucleotidyltransferase
MPPKRQTAPYWVQGSIVSLLYRSAPGVVLKHWLAQGMRYMGWAEVVAKLLLEALFFLCFLIALRAAGIALVSSMVFAVFLAHTANCLVNGHCVALLRYFGVAVRTKDELLAYPAQIRDRLARRKSVIAVALFGSASRGRVTETSDIDVRVVARDGCLPGLAAAFLVVRERFLALINRFPIDIFVVTRSRGLEKLRSDEPPVVLFDHEGFFRRSCPTVLDYEHVVANSMK